MKTQRALSDEQERVRIEGLLILARIIARRALAHATCGSSRTTEERSTAQPDECAQGTGERTRRDGAS